VPGPDRSGTRPTALTLTALALAAIGVSSLGAGPLFATLALNARTLLGGSLADSGAAAVMLLGLLIFLYGVAALVAALWTWRLRPAGWRLAGVLAMTGLVGMAASIVAAGPSLPLVVGAALFLGMLVALATPAVRRSLRPG
jgi:hypothetical protein